MINKNIRIILDDMLFHTRELLEYLRSIETSKYDAYLEDLIDYTLCTEEDIHTIQHYIFKLEVQLYNLNEGDIYE